MPTQVEWIPQGIRNHPVMSWIVSSVLLVTASAGMTWTVLNATTMGEMDGRNKGLTSEIAYLREEKKTAQERYDAAQASREQAIDKRVDERSTEYQDRIKNLEARNENLIQENANLKSTLSALNSVEHQQAAKRKDSRLSKLNADLEQNNRLIAEVQQLLYKTSASAGYDRASCEKERTNFYSNVCEQASKEESQVRALQEKSSLLERKGEILSGQILDLEGKE